VGLAHIKDAWPATLQELGKRSKRIQAFLNPSRPLRYDGDALVVEVQSAFHETTMSEDRHRESLAEALFASLGIRPSMVFAARGSDISSGGDEGDSQATIAPPKSAPAEAAEIADYETAVPVEQSHDPIELIKKGLGAEVVEERT
jgi:hypothetical protein